MTVTEKSREVELGGEYDVIVAGGGFGGIAAALGAARNGKRALLIENSYMLGGLATAGLITIYLPLCDGYGRQVTYGIAEELFRLSVKYGAEALHKRVQVWLEEYDVEERKGRSRRFTNRFNGNLTAMLYEQLLLKNGVKILYGTAVSSAIVENNRITSVITDSRKGRIAYAADNFIDATGDAILAHVAGAATAEFGSKNRLTPWYYEFLNGKYMLNALDESAMAHETEGIDFTPKYDGCDNESVSKMVCRSHEQIIKHFLLNGGITDNHAVATIGTVAQIRMSRRIKGKYTMAESEVFKRFEDSVGVFSDWRKEGYVFELPYGILISENIKNLAACGRCMSVYDDLWDITRVIPICALSGEAVGVAATMGCDFADVNVTELQRKLRRGDVRIHMDETCTELTEVPKE